MALHPMAASLQSKDYRALMDVIDKLRSKGINRYVHLPQIVVCGDQSSGKSSVLQAISGMSFPAKDNICTRFATELILRYSGESAEERCNVSIIPGRDRLAEERARLEKFLHSSIPDHNDIGALIDEAKEVLGVGGSGGRTFCEDILRIELSGPTQPHLTIVDLPGLFRAGNKDQSSEDAKVVQSLVRSYMKNPRSVILAVVSAQSNFALQEVTQLAREIDRHGARTLGLITKPDTLDVGSNSERDYFNMAQNKDVEFRLGWHVVRNRDFKTRNATNQERDQMEAEFFDQGVWAGLPRSQKGSASLRTRLSEVLKDQILNQLPEVLDEIQNGLDDCSRSLEKLGAPRTALADQRRYLLTASRQFSTLVSEAIDGVYRDKFFGNARDEEGYHKRLRAVVQNTLTEFSHEMRIHGQARKIVETASSPGGGSREVTRAAYMKEVKSLMSRTRGCELPGTYNPLVIGELFREQCVPWKGLLNNFSGKVYKAVESTLNCMLAHVVDEDTKRKLWEELIGQALNQLQSQLKDKITELLRLHEDGHPITYNHYLTETVQEIRRKRMRDSIMSSLKKAGGVTATHILSNDPLVDQIVAEVGRDMEVQACSDAIDWMEAYYKVALKRVTDDFSTLGIEESLISHLPKLFTPEIVFDLGDEMVKGIAGESAESAEQRRLLTEKMEILTSGMAELRRLCKGHQRISEVDTPRSSPPFPASEEGIPSPASEEGIPPPPLKKWSPFLAFDEGIEISAGTTVDPWLDPGQPPSEFRQGPISKSRRHRP
ncbi:P-loop containing nucleoside triphosphate hydrolase protein [Durotheca rogersii]|uniref:P-loop containing nucleoside triphosphate hydrolase protein n=1 Tax=Durotheca rogersii TaxID=419775 RepID=UPI0022210362|nr:P-loop containing nucleoside triphosphate hydrolase protein [Durotheca rogersii]KAI5863925.1 P-loop containing nucleoside triphosphate hydrolase protein [Durotheca rogersii]